MPRVLRSVLASLVAAAAAASFASPTTAQEGPGGYINPGRDCQTITTCQFKKGGSYRGCLSSYSCRTCRLVSAPCIPGPGKSRVCQEFRCGWGA